MRRPSAQLTHEVLVEEARFVLRTLKRDDLFGDKVRLVEAERVLEGHISLAFNEYCNFLNKFGYVRVDPVAKVVEVTSGGLHSAENPDDPELIDRVSRHFARELSSPEPAPPLTSTLPPPRSISPRAVSSIPPDVPSALDPPPRSRSPRPASSIERLGSTPSGLEDVLDRRYRRHEIIGEGTVATVYRGEHATLQRPIALKEARGIFQFASYLRRDEIVTRLRTAVERHAQLRHPLIVQIIDQNPEREYPYFVMELASGGNLRDRMQNTPEGRLDAKLAIRILIQIAHALRFAHEQDILHMGLKPENVLFDGQGNVKLSDFSFAQITERPAADGRHTPVLVGTNAVGYLPPERIQPTAKPIPWTPAADIYALGLMFYEMIIGRLPGRRSPLPSQAAPGLPAAFDDVFDKMTRDELEERYTHMDGVLDDIHAALDGEDGFRKESIVLWAKDPAPLPEPEPEPAPEPEQVEPLASPDLDAAEPA